MPHPFQAQIQAWQRCPGRIRNICILAHVDHGKTSLADSLVAANGLISARMAGRLRYMDSRPDEQARGITMKASAVTLAWAPGERPAEGGPCLIHLIDSPGHVDFSSEVSTAVRLCDGAILVVDVVEGVQPQTKTVLAQAWHEGIQPVLVLNKMDRLIEEKRMTPLDAYVYLSQVLERVNAILGELFASGVINRAAQLPAAQPAAAAEPAEPGLFDWSTGLEEADDSELYFAPERGNVVFASAVDGWGFDVGTFARIYAEKLGFSASALNRTLWGDFYVNRQAGQILPGALAKGKKPLFVSLILENIWTVYEAARARNDRAKLTQILASLRVKVAPRDLRAEDPRQLVNAIFSQWLPLASAILGLVCLKLPAPNALTDERVERLMCSRERSFQSLPAPTRALKSAFRACQSSAEAPVIVFVSKMFPVPRSQLPENQAQPLTPEAMAARRAQAQARLAQPADPASEAVARLSLATAEREPVEDETVFLAFARVFSGELKPHQTIYVLGPKYDPEVALQALAAGRPLLAEGDNVKNSKGHIFQAQVGNLYLLLGRDLEPLESAPAGTIVGIGGLDDFVLKSATLASDPACPAFIEVAQSAVPILRVAVEPAKSSDMAKLVQGLHLLNQADANVQVQITDKGEHILVTAGEVHLERCLRDLTETFAKIEISASEPIVPFRETIVIPPKHDMVNEQMNDDNKFTDKDAGQQSQVIEIQTPDKNCRLKIEAIPLSETVTQILETHSQLFKALSQGSRDVLSGTMTKVQAEVRASLAQALAGHAILGGQVERIWSLGPKRCGPNLLFNFFNEHGSIWAPRAVKVSQYDSSILSGFQMAALAGPLCEEPMMGVAFIVHDIDIQEAEEVSIHGPLSGQIVSSVKEGCRKAFQAHPQRLMAAMYSCDIQVKAEVLGRLFATLGQRHGKVVSEDMVAGSSTFTVTSHLPVVESFQFSQEIFRQTSGMAMPQLVFSHWETIHIDPFWVPRTEEEFLHYGDKADSENQARRYMNDLRKKKGLMIDEKIVEFAEKQRTLTKMK
eukprot:snap_masked-scaffold115_size343722-processed-gene-0.4 protein:Tk09706 transcript:snap_masked-scaffold115_size343722-processed-gene-0.4-mRNA-1 annotation:"elongation factor tu gtp-binding domain-containing protein 1"